LHQRIIVCCNNNSSSFSTQATDASVSNTFSTPRVESLFHRMSVLERNEISTISKLVLIRCGVDPNERHIRGSGPDVAAAAPEVEAEPVVEKTIFDLKLISFDAAAKIKVIKEVRAIAGLGLKEAKELVEGAPKVIQKDIKKDVAEELKKKLEELGAVIEIV
jgi:ribosomal protein L7/L12